MRHLVFTVMMTTIACHGFTQIQLDESSDSVKHDFFLINGMERMDLEPLYDADFTFSSPFGNHVTAVIDSDSVVAENKTGYFHTCRMEPVQMVDSVDVTGDGIKELFLLRAGDCFVTCPNPGPYGVGNQRQTYGAYEVWDLRLKRKIFEIKHVRENAVAISTNVMHFSGYRFDVMIGSKGSFFISGATSESGYESGTYTYNTEKGAYEKE